METYNEKNAKLKIEFIEKRQAAFQKFNAQRQQIMDAKEIAGRRFDEDKQRLQEELDKAIEHEHNLQFCGHSDLSELVIKAKAKIRELHKKQTDNKIAFMNQIREFAKAQNIIVSAYREEKIAIDREKAERQLQIEAEERERKELLSLSNTEIENGDKEEEN